MVVIHGFYKILVPNSANNAPSGEALTAHILIVVSPRNGRFKSYLYYTHAPPKKQDGADDKMAKLA